MLLVTYTKDLIKRLIGLNIIFFSVIDREKKVEKSINNICESRRTLFATPSSDTSLTNYSTSMSLDIYRAKPSNIYIIPLTLD